MPFLCCVPRCNGNYPNGPKVSVFSFPNDEELRKKWIQAIHIDSFKPSKASKVCELDFRDQDIQRTSVMYIETTGEKLSVPLLRSKLVPGAVPSQMPGCPVYLSKPTTSRENPEERRRRLESESLHVAISESIETLEVYNSERGFNNFKELKSKFRSDCFHSDWRVYETERFITIFLLQESPIPTVKCSVQINNDLFMSAFCRDVEIKSLPGITLPIKVSNLNQIDEAVQNCHEQYSQDRVPTEDETISSIQFHLNNLEHSSQNANTIVFLKEQVALLNVHKARRRYSPEIMVYCSILFSISPHAYKFLRHSEYIILPSPSTIKLLCSKFSTCPRFEQNTSSLLKYVSNKFHLLNENDKTVILLIDEIHLKPYCDYKGGHIVSKSQNDTECATGAFVFMLNSMMSAYKEVVHILPVKKVTGEIIHDFLKQIIIGLEIIGFEVLAVVSDNHAINRRAMSLFAQPPEIKISYKHPSDENRQLFFVFDTVHILKCIRNNWLNHKSLDMSYPDFHNYTVEQKASFSALRDMHCIENNNLLKYGYNLSLKALYPSTLERQNVKLALKIFNSNNVTSLRELGPQKHFNNWESTATYIELICNWWDIVNVKTPLKGIRLRNRFQEPITKNSEHILTFLRNLATWLEHWSLQNMDDSLTKETFCAFRHSTEALLKMSHFWLHQRGHSYFLCGKIQTDNLEDRFGKYRQLSGSQYHVSLRQIFESESKLRLQSLMSLTLKSQNFGDFNLITNSQVFTSFISNYDEDATFSPDSLPHQLRNTIIDEDCIDTIEDNMLPLLTYIAGYCSYAVAKKIKCGYCSYHIINEDTENISDSLIRAKDRGGLCYPHNDVIQIISYTYLVVQKFVSTDLEQIFLKQHNNRQVVVYVTLENLPDNIFMGHNCQNHLRSILCKKILHPATNILLNNYCKQKNDVPMKTNMPQCKRRKVDKV